MEYAHVRENTVPGTGPSLSIIHRRSVCLFEATPRATHIFFICGLIFLGSIIY